MSSCCDQCQVGGGATPWCETRLCVPLTGNTCEEMADQIEAARQVGADMIELRLDYLQAWDADSIRSLMRKACLFGGEVIATCRLAAEGGHWDSDEATRVSLLKLAGLSGADFIDVEYQAWRASPNLRQKIGLVCEVNTDTLRPRRKLILSRHDCQCTPANLDAIFAELKGEPCHVVKLACQAQTITDALRMLEALRKTAATRHVIALAMGEAGVITRVLARKFGALLSFAALEVSKESAPGQLTVSQMRSLYRWDALNADTRVYGVIGCPVAHSMSPAILNASFDAAGYNGVYLPMRVEAAYEAFAAFVDGCLTRPWLGLSGCSVTIPHKQNLLGYVESRGGEVEPLARRIGAANTLCVQPGRREDGSDTRVAAYNTDYQGALDALCAGGGCDRDGLRDCSIAVLGAGGASRAIVAGLRDCGCPVTIYNRTGDKARALADEFDATAAAWADRSQTNADVIINCTSIGMWPNVEDTPLPDPRLSDRQVVFDTVYNPIETRLLREARQLGCRTIEGIEMFVNQAAAQFKYWTGQPAPTGVIREVLLRELSR